MRSGSRLQLWGADGKQRLEVRFIPDGAAVPAPTIAPGLESGTCSMHAGMLPALVDMLRNEDTTGVTLNDQPPGRLCISPAGHPMDAAESPYRGHP